MKRLRKNTLDKFLILSEHFKYRGFRFWMKDGAEIRLEWSSMIIGGRVVVVNKSTRYFPGQYRLIPLSILISSVKFFIRKMNNEKVEKEIAARISGSNFNDRIN